MCGGRGECPVDTHEDDIAVSLVIKGNLPAAGSRAALSDLDGTLAESYININDLYILAFEIDPTKGVADGESKLKDIIWSPQQAERLPESSISSNGTVVLLRTFLSSEKYKEDEPFALVAVSNISNWGGESYTLSTEKDKETTLADLQKTLTYPIVMDSRWVPDNAKSDGIPSSALRDAASAATIRSITTVPTPTTSARHGFSAPSPRSSCLRLPTPNSK